MRCLPLFIVLPSLLAPSTSKWVVKRVLVINFDPIIKSKGNERLHRVGKWNDPRKLTKEYIKDLEECSWGYARYRVVQWIDVDEFPPKIDGFRYSEKKYLDCLAGKSEWHKPDGVDYKYIIEKFNIKGGKGGKGGDRGSLALGRSLYGLLGKLNGWQGSLLVQFPSPRRYPLFKAFHNNGI